MFLSPLLIPERRDSGARPYWSMMIPTYNARADYLEEMLRSVLAEGPRGGPDADLNDRDDGCNGNWLRKNR